MHFTLDDIQHMTDSATFQRGERYFRQHGVLSVKLDEVHEQLVAEVQGTELYEVYVFWEDDMLVADCSCPVEYNCKHGVAAALQWLNNTKASKKTKTLPTRGQKRQPPALSPLEQWLASLPANAATKANPDKLPPSRHYLLYRLEFYQDQFVLALYKAYLKKDGSWGQQKPYHTHAYNLSWGTPEFYLPEDARLQRLLPAMPTYNQTMLTLQGEDGYQVLTRLLPGWRLLPPFGNQPLRQAAPRPLSWVWKNCSAGQQLVARLDGLSGWKLLATEPPCYLDTKNSVIGEIITPLDTERLAHLCAMPPVPDEQMATAAVQLRRAFTAEQLPLAREPDFVTLDTPVPHLVLAVTPANKPVPGARLLYDYGDITLPPDYLVAVTEPVAMHQHEGRQYLIKRDLAAEQRACEQLKALNLALLSEQDNFWMPSTPSNEVMLSQWQQHIEQDFPELERQGWHIRYDPDYRLDIEDAAFEMALQDGEHGWFDFSLGVQLGDTKLDTAELIGAWLQAGMPNELLLPVNGNWLRLNTQPLTTIGSLLLELYNGNKLNDAVSLPPFEAALLGDLPSLDMRQAPATAALMAQLQHFTGLQTVPAPAGLQAELRPYQQQGLNWLGFLHSYGFGGILADDMGLGKTLQTLALLQHLKENNKLQQPAMIVAPTSLMGNWKHEAARFAPALKVLTVHGPKRASALTQLASADLVLTTYPLLLRDHEHYAEQHFSLLVLDEAQAIKNPVTKAAQRVRQLKAEMKLCLSGTPLENHLGELWSLMDFALPGLLGGRSTFNKAFRQPIENHGDHDAHRLLSRKLTPFMLRRTKADVVTELPEKTEIVQYVELQGKQRALYESIRVSMEQRIRELFQRQGLARSHIEFLDALLKLRQACIDPRLVKLEQAAAVKEHAKLDWLSETIPRLLEEGRNILVFSQFTQVLGLIEEDLNRQGIDYSKLTGQTRHRQQAIDRFQQGEVRVFLISLKAGGSGLNLTAADVVIHVDPWWNPAVENQATDRAHRIGQNKPVFVYRLVATDTVEERIQQMQQQKQALADALFSETGSQKLPADADSLLALLR
ncbi:DEAD/DEAH box helicase [Oceanimonas marisflavi]|uniref:DEAD/DEAH box helicase n=1 Tax=Oceanimonas marisflavi TaxID=2059724 RepID=UPI00130022CC|nr:DEAD/DEAH box helicase [Oceanimonas marisflavi]